MDHFNRRDYPGYLHFVQDKTNGRLKKNPGYSTGTTEREAIFRLFHAYIENHGYRIKHNDLLEQLQEINEDMGDFDLFVAAGMALMADEDENNHFYGGEEDIEDGEELDEYFQQRKY